MARIAVLGKDLKPGDQYVGSKVLRVSPRTEDIEVTVELGSHWDKSIGIQTYTCLPNDIVGVREE